MPTVRFAVLISVSAVIILSQTKFVNAQTKSTSLTASSQSQSSQPLDWLNPSPNPLELLELPTTPEQVRLQQAQPITLQQPIALAQRNNRELQITHQTLQRSQAALQQARIARLPTLRDEAEFSPQQTAKNKLDDLDDDENFSPKALLGNTVEINYDIFTSGRRPARIKAA